MTWHAVGRDGTDLSTGRPPRPPGHPSPAAALSAAPVPAWPVDVVGGGGQRVGFAEAVGPGGDRVEDLLDALAGDSAGGSVDLEALAAITPAGQLDLPVACVGLADGVEAAAQVDPLWLAAVDHRRLACREALVATGRSAEMEAALHVAMLVATERLDPDDDGDVDAHMASGARLWLVAGAVVSFLSGARPDPFEAWADLVAAGWWPVGPSGGRLVLSAATTAAGG